MDNSNSTNPPYNHLLHKEVLIGKRIKIIGDNESRCLAMAHTSVKLKSYCEMYEQGILTIAEDLYQRWIAWQPIDFQNLIFSMDHDLDINPIVVWLKNDVNGGPDEIVDGGHRTRVTHGFINNTVIPTRDGRNMHVKYTSTSGGKRENFNKMSAAFQKKILNYQMNQQLIFVMNDVDYDDYESNVVSLKDVIVPYSNLSKDEQIDVDKYIRNQYVGYQHGRQNNKHEKRRAASEPDGFLKKHIDALARDLPATLTSFKGTRTKRDEYLTRVLWTVAKYKVGDAAPSQFFGLNKDDEVENLYLDNEKLKNNPRVKHLKERSEELWKRFKKAQKICKNNGTVNGFVHNEFAEGKCFTEKDGWLLTAYAFDYIFNCNKYDINDTEEEFEFLGFLLNDVYSRVSKMLSAFKKSADNLEALPTMPNRDTDRVQWIAWQWAMTLSRNNTYDSFAETNKAKWEWLEDLFHFHNDSRNVFIVKGYDKYGKYSVAAG